MSDRETFLARLEDVHDFPCDFIIKVIGANNATFISQVVQAAVNALGSEAQPGVETRESSGGKHLSITLTISVDEPDEILDVYELISEIEEVKFLL